MQVVAGVDEVGRGPLAGPVVCAAVILPNSQRQKWPMDLLKDSKQLSQPKRVAANAWVQEHALAYSISIISAQDIDIMNIRQATLKGIKQCVKGLSIQPTKVMIDGVDAPIFDDQHLVVETVIKGDQTVACISAASIVAKVARDTMMMAWDKDYPEYGFSQHKGYPTAQHLKALKQFGPCPLHRKSFAPVRQSLAS
jgi:ribonuclease HII